MIEKTPEDYLKLVPPQHRELPKFSSVVKMVTQGPSDLTASINDWPLKFDLETAIGDQLDIIGEWIGFSRQVKIPLDGIYLSFEDADPLLGWGEGRWKGSFDETSQLQLLGDADYRRILKTLILMNHWDGSWAQLLSAWTTFFEAWEQVWFYEFDVDPDSGQDVWDDSERWLEKQGSKALLVDGQDMTLSVFYFNGSPEGFELAMLKIGLNIFKPAAVQLAGVFTTESDYSTFFSWDMDIPHFRGWGLGEWPSKLDTGPIIGLEFDPEPTVIPT